jgi:hypothetical protein
MERKALKLALEALENSVDLQTHIDNFDGEDR